MTFDGMKKAMDEGFTECCLGLCLIIVVVVVGLIVSGKVWDNTPHQTCFFQVVKGGTVNKCLSCDLYMYSSFEEGVLGCSGKYRRCLGCENPERIDCVTDNDIIRIGCQNITEVYNGK